VKEGAHRVPVRKLQRSTYSKNPGRGENRAMTIPSVTATDTAAAPNKRPMIIFSPI
jgi:hypothetical protein